MKSERKFKRYEVRTTLNLKIVVLSVTLMYVGAVFPFFFSNHSQTEWLAFIMGTAIAVGANIILMWGLKNHLVRVFQVKVEIPIRGTVVEKNENT